MAMIKTTLIMIVMAVLFFGTVSIAHQHGKGRSHSEAISHYDLSYTTEEEVLYVTFSGQPVGACDTTLQAYLIGDDGQVYDLGVISIVKDIAINHYDETNTTFGWFLPPIEGDYILRIYVDSSCGLFSSDSTATKGVRVRI